MNNLNKPLLLNFFATWCIPCRKELPALELLSNEFNDIDFYLINVSGLKIRNKLLDEKPKLIKEMLNNLDVDIPVVMDKNAFVLNKYGAPLLPRVVIINEDGKIVLIWDGYAAGDENNLRDVLSQL